MKKWEKPEMVKLNVNRTAGGDEKSTIADWTIYTVSGEIKDQKFGTSGTVPADAVVNPTEN